MFRGVIDARGRLEGMPPDGPRLALLSDVHGNLHALEAVLAEIEREGVELVAFLGDLVGYGANPAACVRLARERGIFCLKGNHEALLFEAAIPARERDGRKARAASRLSGSHPVLEPLLHALDELSAADLDWLENLALVHEIPGGWAAHASFEDFGAWNYVFDAESAKPSLDLLQQAGGKIGFAGHTHVQQAFWDEIGGPRPEPLGEGRWHWPEGLSSVVTVGAVGQPRDGDPRAAWTMWDPSSRTLEFRRTAYDVRAAAAAILDADLPDELALRLFIGN